MLTPDFRSASLAIARKMMDNQPLPAPGDKFWRQYPSILDTERFTVYSAARELANAQNTFADLPDTSPITDVYGGGGSAGAGSGFGPLDTDSGSGWTRVGVPIGTDMVWRAIRISFDWGMTKEEVSNLIKDKAIKTLKRYFADGSYDPDQFVYADFMVY